MIPIADTDILSMFGKVKSINTLRLLFNELYVPTAVYEELLRAKDAGLSFIDYVLDDIEVINLSEGEHHEYISLLKNEKYLHKGEVQAIIICKHRGGVLLTNDKKAKKFCAKNGIPCFDIKGILRAFLLRDILNEIELRQLISQIEDTDNTTIKGIEEIFLMGHIK